MKHTTLFVSLLVLLVAPWLAADTWKKCNNACTSANGTCMGTALSKWRTAMNDAAKKYTACSDTSISADPKKVGISQCYDAAYRTNCFPWDTQNDRCRDLDAYGAARRACEDLWFGENGYCQTVTVHVPNPILLDKSRRKVYFMVDECESNSPREATRSSSE